MCIQRFVFDDWVPKKLEIELSVPNGEGANVDFQQYESIAGGKPLDNEEGMPEEAGAGVEVEPELDAGLLNQVL